MTVFEPSYLKREGWCGACPALGRRQRQQAKRVFAVNASIDQAAIRLGIATRWALASDSNANGVSGWPALRTNTLVAIGAAPAAESNDLEESGRVEVAAELTAPSRSDAIL